MRFSKVFLLIVFPLVLVSLGAWLFSVTRGSVGVKVAGEVLGTPNLKLEILSAQKLETPGGKRYQVELEVRNAGSVDAHVNPYRFQMVVSRGVSAGTTDHYTAFFTPLHAISRCDEAPDSVSLVPPGSRRRVSLLFWGEAIPDDWEEGGYSFSLEYYDEEGPVAFSRMFNPT